MKLQHIFIASLCVVGFALPACSSDDSDSGGGSFTCPAVGSKDCPNDEATTQADYDSCTKCKAEAAALQACAGAAKCGADGKSEAIDANKCPNEIAAALKCAMGK